MAEGTENSTGQTAYVVQAHATYVASIKLGNFPELVSSNKGPLGINVLFYCPCATLHCWKVSPFDSIDSPRRGPLDIPIRVLLFVGTNFSGFEQT